MVQTLTSFLSDVSVKGLRGRVMSDSPVISPYALAVGCDNCDSCDMCDGCDSGGGEGCYDSDCHST